jgi:hypothetical protein
MIKSPFKFNLIIGRWRQNESHRFLPDFCSLKHLREQSEHAPHSSLFGENSTLREKLLDISEAQFLKISVMQNSGNEW